MILVSTNFSTKTDVVWKWYAFFFYSTSSNVNPSTYSLGIPHKPRSVWFILWVPCTLRYESYAPGGPFRYDDTFPAR